jgi:SAM-dependent methyltransferase
MFTEMPVFLDRHPIRNFLDVGCGFGVAGCFLLESYPQSKAYAVEPSGFRTKAAAAAMGDRGHVFQGGAPDFERPEFPARFDAIFALDMLHFLSDTQLHLALQRMRDRLEEDGLLVIRCPVSAENFESWDLWFYRVGKLLTRTPAFFRTSQQLRECIERAGFAVGRSQLSGTNPELFWYIATKSPNFQDKMHVEGDRDHQQQQPGMDRNQSPQVQVDELVPLLQKTQPA